MTVAIEPVPVEEINPEYLKMVDWMLEDRSRIERAWSESKVYTIFAYASPTRTAKSLEVGCLSMIRQDPEYFVAEGDRAEEIRAAIAGDELLPTDVYEETTREQLLRFAQWQTALDRLWNRTPPTFE